MAKLTIDLSPQASDMIDQALATGLFGLTREEIALRLVDKGLIDLWERRFVELRNKTEFKLVRRGAQR